MATATNMTFAGINIVNITGVGGFYAQIHRQPDAMGTRDISLHNVAYRDERAIGLAQNDRTAEIYVFRCISETGSWALAQAFIDVMAAFQQLGTLGSLVFATPTFNGMAETLTNMKLKSFPLGAPVIQAPAQGSNWRVHFTIKFVRFGT